MTSSPEEKEIISKLRPQVASLAQELKQKCAAAGVPIRIIRGLRTHEEQEELYARGRTAPGLIVTRRRGGFSFHNYGVAFDIQPIAPEGTSQQDILSRYKVAGSLGTALGLEWGGNWEDFVDMPHFHYTGGLRIEDFYRHRGKIKTLH